MSWLDDVSDFVSNSSVPGGLLSDVASFFSDALGFIANAMLNLVHMILNYVTAIAKTIGRALSVIWNKFFKGIFGKLVTALSKAHEWLESHLRPLLDFLKKVRQYLDRIYFKYIKPFLDLIQHIRRFLLILKLLHVKFAQELDAKLAEVQHSVQSVFLEARTLLNGIIDVVNLVVDPSALLRKPTLLISLRRSIGAVIRITTGLPPAFFFPSPRKNAPLGWAALPSNFDPSNPAHNPPASFYLQGDEGLGAFSFFASNAPLPDSAVDDLEMLDYFDDGLWPESKCTNPAACLSAIRSRQIKDATHA